MIFNYEGLHVYHLSNTDIGDSCVFQPDIPMFTANDEDKSIKRICVCASIPACILAIQSIPLDVKNGLSDYYLYESIIRYEDIYQPEMDQVYDSWITGELWVVQPYEFYRTCHYKIRRHMKFPGIPYSRFSFTADGYDEVIDKIKSDIVYGNKQAFSILLVDPTRNIELEKINLEDFRDD